MIVDEVRPSRVRIRVAVDNVRRRVNVQKVLHHTRLEEAAAREAKIRNRPLQRAADRIRVRIARFTRARALCNRGAVPDNRLGGAQAEAAVTRARRGRLGAVRHADA